MSSISGSATPTFRPPTSRSKNWWTQCATPATIATRQARGIPKLRQAISSLYLRRFGVEIDPDTEAVVTIGAKEGLSHLMWVLLGPGDSALVPSPSYPIHLYTPLFAGADVRQVRLEDPGRPEGGTAGRVLRQHDGVVGVGVAQAPGRGPVVSAQSDDVVCRPGVDATHRRFRP